MGGLRSETESYGKPWWDGEGRKVERLAAGRDVALTLSPRTFGVNRTNKTTGKCNPWHLCIIVIIITCHRDKTKLTVLPSKSKEIVDR